jgi:hypothetical protein
MPDDQWEYIESNPLPSTLIFYPFEKISRAFSGIATVKEDDDDDDVAPTPRRPEPKKEAKESKPNLDVTFEEVQEMSTKELDDLIDDAGLDLDPSSFDTDQDVADAICEALGLRKKERTASKPQAKKEEPPEEKEEHPVEDEATTRRSRLESLRNRRRS